MNDRCSEVRSARPKSGIEAGSSSFPRISARLETHLHRRHVFRQDRLGPGRCLGQQAAYEVAGRLHLAFEEAGFVVLGANLGLRLFLGRALRFPDFLELGQGHDGVIEQEEAQQDISEIVEIRDGVELGRDDIAAHAPFDELHRDLTQRIDRLLQVCGFGGEEIDDRVFDIRKTGAAIYDGEVAITLRAIETGAREARTLDDTGGDQAYLGLMRRLLQVRPGAQSPPPQKSSLILP